MLMRRTSRRGLGDGTLVPLITASTVQANVPPAAAPKVFSLLGGNETQLSSSIPVGTGTAAIVAGGAILLIEPKAWPLVLPAVAFMVLAQGSL